ncbi:hypothetical protein ASPSYDRAFT_46413 [Aspergillus sydowii CBS 593.65]|uniref:Sialidase domain-containing protein n=1 Tax=Aspergillus sydowii CBS 593.65 TaxID=1036612 RepID=A0A1L9TG75_9EURO|nr:uncharacterized protein ASPSYDRAFT_46413 [Aspergillus sydowii CBS 593.65]OJJ58395.1 hypothetical protein ASPSYDRAFT_46413 [Aspergillus sydowii CBS 593.65]
MRFLKFLHFLATAAFANVDDPAADKAQSHNEFALFRSANMNGADKLSTGIGFHSFRIPAVVRTKSGRLIAFAEGRRFNDRDFGDINLVYKRTKSTDGVGKTINDWEGLREVIGAGDGTWGNPAPVVDDDGTIYLWMSWNNGSYSQTGLPLHDGTPTKPIDDTWAGRRHLFLTYSKDEGETWSEPQDFTKALTPEGRTWDAVGPGIGIRLTSGELVVPAQERNLIGRGEPGKREWTAQDVPGAGSEGTIVELPNGRLQRNDRKSGGYRIISYGTVADGFGEFKQDTGLPDPGCQGSILSYNRGEDLNRTIFMNAADAETRRSMRVRVTYDDAAGKYNYGRKLDDAPVPNSGYQGGYSSMVKTGDYHIGALVESDFFNDGSNGGSYRTILWRRFNLSWILNGPNN